MGLMEEGGRVQPEELTFSMTQLSQPRVGAGGGGTPQGGQAGAASWPGYPVPGLQVGPQESHPCWMGHQAVTSPPPPPIPRAKTHLFFFLTYYCNPGAKHECSHVVF